MHKVRESEQTETIYMKKTGCMFKNHSSSTIVFAAFLCPGDAVRISLMYLLDEALFDGAPFYLLTGMFVEITGDNVIIKLSILPTDLSSAGSEFKSFTRVS